MVKRKPQYVKIKEYIIQNIDFISSGLFFRVSEEYMKMNDDVFKYKGISRLKRCWKITPY